MSDEEILEGNKLIAEFMGGKYYPNGGWSEWQFPDGGKPSILYYNSSWDWIMPVVDKIMMMQNNPDEKIIDFIKWYNQQSK